MPIRLGATELLVILAIVLLLFGVGRIGRVASELGRSFRLFREGVSGETNQPADETPPA